MPIHLQNAFNAKIRNLEQLGILEQKKDATEWVISFVIVEKKLPIYFSNSHSPGHTIKKKLRICLDPRDLNEALEHEPYYTRSIEEIPIIAVNQVTVNIPYSSNEIDLIHGESSKDPVLTVLKHYINIGWPSE